MKIRIEEAKAGDMLVYDEDTRTIKTIRQEGSFMRVYFAERETACMIERGSEFVILRLGPS